MFSKFSKAVSEQLDRMSQGELFTVEINKSDLWDLYLASFPEGTNPIYKERTEHDCNCCKQFIKTVGNVVAIIDGQLETIWDINSGTFYDDVANTMSTFVKVHPINGVFRHDVPKVGTEQNFDAEGNKHEHFSYTFDSKFITRTPSPASIIGKSITNKRVLERSLTEMDLESVSTVLELIAQGSLYRGEEHKGTLTTLRKCIKEYNQADVKHYYVWLKSVELGGVSAFKNTVIGTLVYDLSQGEDLETAVGRFESKVAPANYKRSTAPITQNMIKKAQEKVQALGFESALHRRYAHIDDITINNVIYADRSAKEAMGVFDQLSNEVKVNTQKFDRVEEVGIEDFVKNILPTVDKVELLVDNKHESNLVSLIAPQDEESKGMFKWGNNFSWSYNGEVADSMKERVKAAGGRVDGELRFSIQWNDKGNDNVDLDAHCHTPRSGHIFYSNKNSRGGKLDVDIINPAGKVAVENITWDKEPPEGTYKFRVHNYGGGMCNNGFTAEIEYKGKIYSYAYSKKIAGRKFIDVATVEIKNGELKFIDTLPNSVTSKEIWGIDTLKFHKVDTIMNSPNHWDGEETGNKHWFFMLDGCKNPDQARGFYNEFLNEELTEHRKVFEVLGSKLKAEESDDQLSGLGFSSTQRNDVVCKLTGNFNRMVKIKF